MNKNHQSASVVVAQRGSREQFQVARSLMHEGCLLRLCTDWYPKRVRSLFRLGAWGGSHLCRRALSSHAADVPWHYIRAWNVWAWYAKARERNVSPERCYEQMMANNAAFAARVSRQLAREPEARVLYIYSYAARTALAYARERGIATVLNQIDPGPRDARDVPRDEARRWPELAGSLEPVPDSYLAHARREWELSDLIVVNSEWSRRALVAEGVDDARIRELPLCYTPPVRLPDRSSTFPQGPLKVLWLGNVTLRKGFGYFQEAASFLRDEDIVFDVVGSHQLSPQAMAALPPNIRIHGPCARQDVSLWYRQSDVFVLPTVSDGFALTQLEALAHGIPVVTTPNCARVITDGKDGLVVPARDAHALAAALLRLRQDPAVLLTMREHTGEVLTRFSAAHHRRKLMAILAEARERAKT